MADRQHYYEKDSHTKRHSGDWEAPSVCEEDSKGLEVDLSESTLEENSHPLGEETSGYGHSSTPDDRKGSDISTEISPPQSRFSTKEAPTDSVDKIDEHEPKVIKKIRSEEPPCRHSPSSAFGSAISSPTNSPASASSHNTSLSSASSGAVAPAVDAPPKPTVRFTDRGPPLTFAKSPAAPRRHSYNPARVAEWGVLFDEKGYATYRNGQFLRGLAKHIIDDFAPDSSNIVVTPEKLSGFYSKYSLDPDTYPFLEIFSSKARDVHERIADFYTDLDCQYHLVQLDSRAHSRPRVPALTPIGFAQYLTACVLAHPDEEFRRLDKVVTDVQLEVAGSATVAASPAVVTTGGQQQQQAEKLPRQLVRSLFPVEHDPKSRKILAAALDDLMYDLGLLPSPKSPLALAALPPTGSRSITEKRWSVPSVNTSSSSFTGAIRRYTPEKPYARKEAYYVPATTLASPERPGKIREKRYFVPGSGPLQTVDDGTAAATSMVDDRSCDRERQHQSSGTTNVPIGLPLPAPRGHFSTSSLSSPRASQGEGSFPPPATTAWANSHQRPYSDIAPPPVPPSSGSNRSSNTSLYSPSITSARRASSGYGNRRSQSPPPRTYNRASTLDITSTCGSGSTSGVYFKPVVYHVPAGGPGTTAADPGSPLGPGPRDGVSSRNGSIAGLIGPSSPQTKTIVRSSTGKVIGTSGSASAASMEANVYQPVHSHSHSNSRSDNNITTTNDNGGGGGSSRRASTTAITNAAAKGKENENMYHYSRRSQHPDRDRDRDHHRRHHHHHRRRSASVTIAADDDKGPTWEEVLKAPHTYIHGKTHTYTPAYKPRETSGDGRSYSHSRHQRRLSGR
ncbi:hypothetical protein AAE478_005434 [Parahypoxylon ruwenzoriense]